MPLTIAVGRERSPGERRVALVPETAKKYASLGAALRLEAGAGLESHFTDGDYAATECKADLAATYGGADVILRVTPPTPEEIALMPEGAILLGLMQPWASKERLAALNARKLTVFALELLPRISRAQSMDVLSSQASCAGYQCGLIGAARSTRFFPMLTTAAGTIRPARVLVIGAGVAGLQAIATCKRLGPPSKPMTCGPPPRSRSSPWGPSSSTPASLPTVPAAMPGNSPRRKRPSRQSAWPRPWPRPTW